jgi:hypothetical protein
MVGVEQEVLAQQGRSKAATAVEDCPNGLQVSQAARSARSTPREGEARLTSAIRASEGPLSACPERGRRAWASDLVGAAWASRVRRMANGSS